MKKQGVATISIPKPYFESDNAAWLEMYLYDANGKLVWDGFSGSQRDIPTNKYRYKVGLNKGNYVLRVYAPFLLGSPDTVKSTLTIRTVVNPYWEVEGNDRIITATPIRFNKKYVAIYGENYRQPADIFKVKLKKGKTYKIKIGNYDELFARPAVCQVLDPKKKVETGGIWGMSVGNTIETNGAVKIKAKKTGYYYIKIDVSISNVRSTIVA